jgi:hypothetical protein
LLDLCRFFTSLIFSRFWYYPSVACRRPYHRSQLFRCCVLLAWPKVVYLFWSVRFHAMFY